MTESVVFIIILLIAIVCAVAWYVISNKDGNYKSNAVADSIREKNERSLKRDEYLKAIEEKQFEPYIQLVYNVSKKKCTGGELLARWNHPSGGVLEPGKFVDELTELGMEDKLDFYMFENACRLLHELAFGNLREICLSCNFTRKTLSMSDFAKRYESIIGKYDFERKHLMVEITEDTFFDSGTIAYNNIQVCKKSGVEIAIDDLGAGKSSLYDMCDYPVDCIKLDKQLIKKYKTERGSIVFRGIVSMAHELGIGVLCEGIENDADLEFAVNMGCDFVQGYYYSEPLPLKEGLALLSR